MTACQAAGSPLAAAALVCSIDSAHLHLLESKASSRAHSEPVASKAAATCDYGGDIRK